MALDMSRLSMIEARLAQLLPGDVAVACTDPTQDVAPDEVFAVEAAAMARAVPKRRREFFAGRVAARRAMAGLGHPPAPVAMGADRAPVWPEGLTGSISHGGGTCAAVIGDAVRFRALAVDLEPDLALPDEVCAAVCDDTERAWIGNLPGEARGRAARLIFSAKECAYKLQYPLTGKLLDFNAMRIAVDVDNAVFEAGFNTAVGAFPKGHRIKGRFGVEAGIMFCVMFMPQSHEIA